MDDNSLQQLIDYFKKTITSEDSLHKAEDIVYNYYSKGSSHDRKKLENIQYHKKNDTKQARPIFDRGWFYDRRVESFFHDTGKYLLTKGSDSVSVGPDRFVIDADFQDISTSNNYVKIYIYQYEELDSWNWIHGCNFFNSNTIRIYFSFKKNKRAESIRYMNDIKGILDQKDVPFRIKYEKEFSDRHENAVMYFQRSDYYPIFFIISILSYDYNNIFRNTSPPFLKHFKNFKGIFFAEDPLGDSSSFGMSIAKITAKILYRSRGNIYLDEFKNALVEEGLHYTKMYLNPYTDFRYSFLPLESTEMQSLNLRIDFTSQVNLGLQKYLKVIHKLCNIIVRNLFISQREDIIQIKILEGNQVKDASGILSSNVNFTFHSEDLIKEVVDVFDGYRSYLHNHTDYQDDYIDSFSVLLSNYIAKENSSIKNSKISMNKILFETNDRGFLQPSHIVNVFDQDSDEIIQIFADSLAERGIISYLPDSEFVCSYSKRGYNYIIKNLLLKLTKTLPES